MTTIAPPPKLDDPPRAMASVATVIVDRPRSSGALAIDLALGFAGTVAMWAVGYVCMTAPGLVVGEFLFALTIAALLGVAILAGRLHPIGFAPTAGWRRGLRVGLVSATVNLLIVGSLFGSGSDLATAALWIGGLYVVSAAVGVAGGAVGQMLEPMRREIAPLGLFGAVAATAVFLLLITGGLVTGMEAGLAVPDWPNSFGHNMLLYPLSEMTGGIYYEHAHRLYGMLVGVTALTFLVLAWRLDRRNTVRFVTLAVFTMVCVQGLLGGLRVTGNLTMSQDAADLAPNLTLAIVHGVFGQVIFATLCGLAVVTSGSWSRATPSAVAGGDSDRFLSAALPFAIVGQLVLGACYRHLQVHGEDGLLHHPLWALHSHIAFGVLVAALAIAVGLRSWGRHGDRPVLRRLGLALIATICLQLLLGTAALVAVFVRPGVEIPVWELLITSAHQATGAVLLGMSTMLALWTRRLVAESPMAPAIAQPA
ncbi:MAG: COX15/CtaA family protein [Phycisphaerales bacterium]